MGSQVSFDRQPIVLSQICSIIPSATSLAEYESNLKVWKFNHHEQDSDLVVCNGVQTLDEPFDPRAAYLLLVTSPARPPASLCAPIQREHHRALLHLACTAATQSSPRGLRHPYCQREAGRPVGATVYVWNGKGATRLVEAQALVQAVHLDRLLNASSGLAAALFNSGDPTPIYDCISALPASGFHRVSPPQNCHLLTKVCPSSGSPRLTPLAALLGLTPSDPTKATAGGVADPDTAGLQSPLGSSTSDSSTSSAYQSGPEERPKPLTPALNLNQLSEGSAHFSVPSPVVPAIPLLHLPTREGPVAKPAASRIRPRVPTVTVSKAKPAAASAREMHTKPLPSPRSSGQSPCSVPRMTIPHIPRLPTRDSGYASPPVSDPSREKLKKMQTFGHVPAEIEPHLFVGSHQPAEDETWLLRTGITDVINLAATSCPNRFPALVNYWDFPLYDAAKFDIFSLFPETLRIIEDARKAGGKTYVHCSQGISRSCTVVIAYLMWAHGLSYQPAFDRVKNGRPLCSPNPGFIASVMRYGAQLATPKQILLWRLAPYDAESPVPFVLRQEGRVEVGEHGPEAPQGTFKPPPTALDPRSCYLLAAPPHLFTWKGEACCPEWLDELARQTPKMLLYCFSRAADLPPLTPTQVAQGHEPSDFLQLCRLVCSPAMTFKPVEEYDPVYSPEAVRRCTLALEDYLRALTSRRPGVRPLMEGLTAEKRKRNARTLSNDIPRKSPRSFS